MEPTLSIPRSPSFGDLYAVSHDREDESFFITQEEQANIIQQIMDGANGEKEPEPK